MAQTNENISSENEAPVVSHVKTPEKEEGPGSRSPEERCPQCPEDRSERRRPARREDWVECEGCNKWYHWRCAGDGSDVNTLLRWFCGTCLKEDPSRVITYKAPTRKSTRKRNQQDYANLEAGMSDSSRWINMLSEKVIHLDPFKRMAGSDVDIGWLEDDETAMLEPIVVESPEGLGIKMPPSDFTVDDVASELGEHTPVEVIDVASQSASPGWTLGTWADYMELEPEKRDKIYNVISLEVSGTKIAELVTPPKLVRDLDWVENFWPSTRKGKGVVYPKVQLYCLMGVAKAWTDWHIDFAGSSVYYHILSGAKTFYFIRPTPANLAAYERWSGSEIQYQTWLGDLVDKVYKVELTAGNTMIIPAGWIHAVYTPVDTMVFGGNFLHTYNVATQIKVRNIEIATQVPKKFRFPMFSRQVMLDLANFLVSEVRILERGSEQAKKEVKEQIPVDRVKDAPALARELRWRARLALGNTSADEQDGAAANGAKRKRETASGGGPFRNFKPKVWDDVAEDSEVGESKQLKCTWPKPSSGDGWTSAWLSSTEPEGGEGEDDNKMAVNYHKERCVKVRRTQTGIERHRIERIVEHWEWDL
ncbi:JmjC domain-containing histone demethylation protein 1 [Coprinopsis marcescibilis]|uniref:JmjC domain-containing histone demethylation protein 1 n=1 Tax=Coprinopsis marcescibilis TaxID=230819 RepID=A0A5C3KX54_COPMA|nr:JmjC domain-containing histone demethylation protein 1 [Coprinopsis marcescibilis]